MLTFLAGAQVDTKRLRREWRPALLIGGLSFLLPFVGVALFAYYLARSHAVLPAFLLGLAVADVFKRHPEEQRRLRVVSFAFLTPVFFLKGGLNVDVRPWRPARGC